MEGWWDEEWVERSSRLTVISHLVDGIVMRGYTGSR